jgi:hypothetical protein
MITMEECLFSVDGNMWCCTLSDFTNLQEHPAGFGETQEDAFNALLEEVI